jgi:hypothetical protein
LAAVVSDTVVGVGGGQGGGAGGDGGAGGGGGAGEGGAGGGAFQACSMCSARPGRVTPTAIACRRCELARTLAVLHSLMLYRVQAALAEAAREGGVAVDAMTPAEVRRVVVDVEAEVARHLLAKVRAAVVAPEFAAALGGELGLAETASVGGVNRDIAEAVRRGLGVGYAADAALLAWSESRFITGGRETNLSIGGERVEVTACTVSLDGEPGPAWSDAETAVRVGPFRVCWRLTGAGLTRGERAMERRDGKRWWRALAKSRTFDREAAARIACDNERAVCRAMLHGVCDARGVLVYGPGVESEIGSAVFIEPSAAELKPRVIGGGK